MTSLSGREYHNHTVKTIDYDPYMLLDRYGNPRGGVNRVLTIKVFNFSNDKTFYK